MSTGKTWQNISESSSRVLKNKNNNNVKSVLILFPVVFVVFFRPFFRYVIIQGTVVNLRAFSFAFVGPILFWAILFFSQFVMMLTTKTCQNNAQNYRNNDSHLYFEDPDKSSYFLYFEV